MEQKICFAKINTDHTSVFEWHHLSADTDPEGRKSPISKSDIKKCDSTDAEIKQNLIPKCLLKPQDFVEH